MDAARAIDLQRELASRLRMLGYPIKVFNTSVPEDRYKALEQIVASGANWRLEAEVYEEELQSYLAQNLKNSIAYLLLVTPGSLAAQSKWITFEIDTAQRKAENETRPFFFPVVEGGASLSHLPAGAKTFQGIDLQTPGGVDRLVEAIVHGISTQDDSR